jgi:hypothetical protein
MLDPSMLFMTRLDTPNYPHHVINRAVMRLQIFEKEARLKSELNQKKCACPHFNTIHRPLVPVENLTTPLIDFVVMIEVQKANFVAFDFVH